MQSSSSNFLLKSYCVPGAWSPMYFNSLVIYTVILVRNFHLSTSLQKAFTEYLLCARLCYILEMQTVKETQCLSSMSENSGLMCRCCRGTTTASPYWIQKSLCWEDNGRTVDKYRKQAQGRAKGTLLKSQYGTFSSSIRLYFAKVRKNWTWGYGCLSWNPMANWTTRPPEDWILAPWPQPQKSFSSKLWNYGTWLSKAYSCVSLFKCKRESDWSVPCGCKTDILTSLLTVSGDLSQRQRLSVFIATSPLNLEASKGTLNPSHTSNL